MRDIRQSYINIPPIHLKEITALDDLLEFILETNC